MDIKQSPINTGLLIDIFNFRLSEYYGLGIYKVISCIAISYCTSFWQDLSQLSRSIIPHSIHLQNVLQQCIKLIIYMIKGYQYLIIIMRYTIAMAQLSDVSVDLAKCFETKCKLDQKALYTNNVAQQDMRERLPNIARLTIYSYLTFNELIIKIAKLNKKQRKLIQGSHVLAEGSCDSKLVLQMSSPQLA
ncbi:hypothetical protein FGO68_gene16219 [Halteria grandinella]|uniref:Uncharacterized protein n=1 Tax=Halteria grandinella TaxID=5974 RepID=A0A8J8T3S3_HALGN|nr:hypothetical protein FGO68_gene16219 [Halteria grandinella]